MGSIVTVVEFSGPVGRIIDCIKHSLLESPPVPPATPISSHNSFDNGGGKGLPSLSLPYIIIVLIIVTSGTQSLSATGAIPNSEGFSLQPARVKTHKKT